MQKKEAVERDIAKELTFYNEDNCVVGETLSESTQVFRVKVVTTFLIPLNKFDIFRKLFEENEYQLTDKRNMFDLIPFIQKREIDATVSQRLKERMSLFVLMAPLFQVK